jgi:uncharacterized coiled-coil DUF342 family protein
MVNVREYQIILNKLQQVRDEYQELKGRIAQVRETVGQATVEELGKKLKTLVRKRDELNTLLQGKCKEFLDESELGIDEDEG